MSDWHHITTTALVAATGFALGATAVQLSRSFRPSQKGSNSKTVVEDESVRTAAQECLVQAVNFSAYKHRDQRRKNSKQIPYINHPLSVAARLVAAGVQDVDILVAAILHDTVEDTDTTIDEVMKKFGPSVASIVSHCSDDKSLPKQERKRLQIEHARHCSHDAKLVKLADKLDNLTDLLTDTPIGWTPERVSEYFEWAEKVVNGLRETNRILEAQLDEVFAKRQVAIDAASSYTSDSDCNIPPSDTVESSK